MSVSPSQNGLSQSHPLLKFELGHCLIAPRLAWPAEPADGRSARGLDLIFDAMPLDRDFNAVIRPNRPGEPRLAISSESLNDVQILLQLAASDLDIDPSAVALEKRLSLVGFGPVIRRPKDHRLISPGHLCYEREHPC
jgi:hypothetical protein